MKKKNKISKIKKKKRSSQLQPKEIQKPINKMYYKNKI